MTYFLKSGNTYRVSKKEALDISEALPAGNYVINKDEMTGQFFLEGIESFNAPKRIYGDCLKNTDRIIRTFMDRPAATGVMLTGEKGSGKTLLTKNVSIELAKQGIPTIVINAPWCGDKFNSFIQSIEQPCAILFDEFEKTYDRDEQESILTLLDGVFPSKKLFLLTANDKYRVDYHMRNRPGRIYYMLDFKGLTAEFITEYCEENLKNQQHIAKICNIASLFAEFNFDMLKALVEEMNRYDESPTEALTMLNAKPEFDSGAKYDVKILWEGKEVEGEMHPSVFEGNPLQPKGIEIGFDTNPDSDDREDWKNMSLFADDLVGLNSASGNFVFEKGNVKLMLTRQKTRYFNYDAF
jgi:hypothetical protein